MPAGLGRPIDVAEVAVQTAHGGKRAHTACQGNNALKPRRLGVCCEAATCRRVLPEPHYLAVVSVPKPGLFGISRAMS